MYLRQTSNTAFGNSINTRMILKALKRFKSQDFHTRQIQLNSIIILVFRGGGIAASFLMIPLAISYLDAVDYGVWLTLTSIVGWLSFMDVGLGNGMRNKLTESLSLNRVDLAKEYVSTTYLAFSFIMIGIFAFFSVINLFLDWNAILNTGRHIPDIRWIVSIIVLSFNVRLVLDLSGIIVIALHKPFIKALVDFLMSVLGLAITYILIKTTSPSLPLFSILISLSPVITLVIFSIALFRKGSKYSCLRPSFTAFKAAHVRSLLGVGLQFFVIQISAMIIFSTDNILITHLFSPGDVTSFNIAYKYFSVSTIVFNIIILPYWSAFTNAYFKRDIGWIKMSFRKLVRIWIIQVIAVFLLILVAQEIYRIWVGSHIQIPLSLSVSLGVYCIIYNWNNMYAYFLNGISKIRLQLYCAVITGLLNIPLSYLLALHTTLGVSSIVLSNCMCLILFSIVGPVQCSKIISLKAQGIWNR